MRIASILVLAELIPVESTVLTKSPGSTGVCMYLSPNHYDELITTTNLLTGKKSNVRSKKL